MTKREYKATTKKDQRFIDNTGLACLEGACHYCDSTN